MEENFYQKKLKQAYFEELSNQMRAKEEAKKREKMMEKSEERLIVDNSVETAKKQIEADKLRTKVLNSRLSKIEQENEWMERQKREQE